MKEALQELIEITTDKLGLNDAAFVEKDFYVTEVLHAMNQVKNNDFDLIFIGGTCLTKAHKIIERMSEDIDFKIVPKDHSRSLKTSSAREKLSHIREELLQQINEKTGLFPKEGQINKGNNNQFTQIFLDYDPIYPIHPTLRPQIKIELTAKVMQMPPEKHSVTSLIYEAMGEASGLSSQSMYCTAMHETAIEKWTALCRYASSVSQQVKEPDPSLVRHFYDLHCIEKKIGISSDFEKMAPMILQGELDRIKGINAKYYANPVLEVKQAFTFFSDQKELFHKFYDAFVNSMVFQKNPPSFQETLDTFEKLHHRAVESIQKSTLFQEKN